ncbi:MAG: MarR family transcriptional regulator [Acidobacteria bacterium]|nr:MarR family transcriptional regulator [Acidobacteriota bacterium]
MEATGPESSSRLQAEIRQTRPFSSPAQEALLGLMRTNDEVRRRINLVVEPRDLSIQQYNVLRILRGAGGPGLATLDVAGRMIERTPGITRLMDKLEAKALVERKRGPADRRQVMCFITQAGLDLLASLDEPMSQSVHDSMAGLTELELRELIGLLDKLRTPVSPTEL